MTDPPRSSQPLRPARTPATRLPAGHAPGRPPRELDPRPGHARNAKARASTRTWHAWIAIHRIAGGRVAESWSQCPRYEFRLPAGPGEWRAAHAELVRQWVSKGEPLAEDAGLSPDDPSLRVYETLRVVLDEVWCLEHQAPLRRVGPRARAGEPSGADARTPSWSAGLPELWSPTPEPTP